MRTNIIGWTGFYRKNFGLEVAFQAEIWRRKNRKEKALAALIPDASRQKTFFSNRAMVLRNMPSGEKYFRFKGWKVILCPYTVGAGFPDNIRTINRSEGEYCLAIDSANEVAEDTLFCSPSNLRNDFRTAGDTGLTLFEFLVFHVLRPDADKIYINLLLSSELSDGRVVCAEKIDFCRQIRVFAWPETYKEHNSQGARRARIFPL